MYSAIFPHPARFLFGKRARFWLYLRKTPDCRLWINFREEKANKKDHRKIAARELLAIDFYFSGQTARDNFKNLYKNPFALRQKASRYTR